MGSRYGGLKQIDPVGPNGEIIMDFSVFDAIRAGFNHIVFIIKEENRKSFEDAIGNKISKHVRVTYVYQSIDKLPIGIPLPSERVKPWGTAHAVYCAAEAIDGPFAVINADDFYGKNAFSQIVDFLKNSTDNHAFCMAGYILKNTMTDNGYVSRGVCEMDSNGYLKNITETTQIQWVDGISCFSEDGETFSPIDENSVVSMNCWGFSSYILSEIKARFPAFFENNKDNINKAEFFLPQVVDELISKKKCTVSVLKTGDKWFGVTYKEDKQSVSDAIAKKISDGEYPEKLW